MVRRFGKFVLEYGYNVCLEKRVFIKTVCGFIRMALPMIGSVDPYLTDLSTRQC